MKTRIDSKNLGVLVIKLISKAKAKEMIIQNHYSHKWNDGGFGLYNFGRGKKMKRIVSGWRVMGI